VRAAPARFIVVGLAGFAIQIAALALLTSLGWGWLPATIVAVEAAIVHNYIWHRSFTWADRRGSFIRFNASTALTSVAGNVMLMAFFVQFLHLPVVAANALAVGIMSLANFIIADRWVFVLILLLAASPVEAAPSADSLVAWNQYVAATEARLTTAQSRSITRMPAGNTIDIGPATISDWEGSVFIPRVTLDTLLYRLQNPGTPPPQDDVVASHVISRNADTLHLYIRLVRRAIVTVTYDTEHDMTFQRLTPATASARSVATRIEEVGGGDKGFLWRLNSYWFYEQTAGGVAVSVRSLTLSRDVPVLVKPLAARIVPRVARESMMRTLEALRAYLSRS